uniref:Uncharacterized protein n=1 Tax=Arundo donax TaxID=35708 RepID=A0A0A9EP50_ARUDO
MCSIMCILLHMNKVSVETCDDLWSYILHLISLLWLGHVLRSTYQSLGWLNSTS